MPSRIQVRSLTGTAAHAYTEQLSDVLMNCVENGASVSFMLPMTRDKAKAFWAKVALGVESADRILFVAEDESGHVLGTVQLIFADPENQPHRADVAKLLVHSDARRRGVAARLMEAIDEAARAAQRTVLVLDTATDSDAERVYQRAGWQRVGVIPNYALMPDGGPCATTFYYKML